MAGSAAARRARVAAATEVRGRGEKKERVGLVEAGCCRFEPAAPWANGPEKESGGCALRQFRPSSKACSRLEAQLIIFPT